MFAEIEPKGVDMIIALMQAFKADPRENKVDLVVGVYKDDAGRVPVLKSVKEAEARLQATEETKNYVGVLGDPELGELIRGLLLGDDSPLIADGRARSFQAPGGTGALKVGFDFLNSLKPGNKVWVSRPTWANHRPTALNAGLTVDDHPYFRESDRALDFDAMTSHLEAEAREGEILLLHACCHNPSGVDLNEEQWASIADLILRKRLFPFVDCAYQGFGAGLEQDVAGLRLLAARVPEMLIASSFSKNFGLYRERAGGLTVIGESKETTDRAMQSVSGLVRSNYSMPPSHGGRIVTTIMKDPQLKQQWLGELAEMRDRIAETRQTLRRKLEERQVAKDVSFLTSQNGMFSYTGFTPEQTKRLREEFGVFAAGDGRINIAGLSSANIDDVAEAFATVMR